MEFYLGQFVIRPSCPDFVGRIESFDDGSSGGDSIPITGRRKSCGVGWPDGSYSEGHWFPEIIPAG